MCVVARAGVCVYVVGWETVCLGLCVCMYVVGECLVDWGSVFVCVFSWGWHMYVQGRCQHQVWLLRSYPLFYF